MNRLVASSTDAIDERSLPPPTRALGAPARVLFLHGLEVGFATTTENLIHYAAARPDIDAVHIRLVMPRWLKLACTQSPFPIGELDYRYLRHMIFWRMGLRTLIGPGTPLPLDRFDVVHIATQQKAGIIRDFASPSRNPTGTRFAINIDATLRGWESMRGLKRLAPPIDWSLERKILRAADMVACATEWAAGSCEREYGVDRSRIVIHKPCARTEPVAKPAREPGSLPRIIFIGGNWIDKGGPRLLAWHQQRWADRAELHIVSGSAPANAAARNVVWHGRVPHDALVRDLIPSMDVFVVPTKWDTFMIAAQEAQAAGLPVVTTRTGGVPECVLDGQTGYLCDHADDNAYITAVERLLNDASLRARMGDLARRHAAVHLNADIWHNHLLSQLTALAGENGVERTPKELA
jgi:glycosyltransferase involved in cell wall biosynthesis